MQRLTQLKYVYPFNESLIALKPFGEFVKKAIPILKESDPTLSVMVGGAPFTQEIADKFGADGYASDAISAVAEAERIMELRQL